MFAGRHDSLRQIHYGRHVSGAGIGICGAGGILEVGRWLGEIVEADRAAGPFEPVRQFAQFFMATGLQGAASKSGNCLPMRSTKRPITPCMRGLPARRDAIGLEPLVVLLRSLRTPAAGLAARFPGGRR